MKLVVCARYGSERRAACEDLEELLDGDEGKAARDNARCTKCGRPIVRIVTNVDTIEDDSTCDYCGDEDVTVAVAAEDEERPRAPRLRICEDCATDAAIMLERARGRD